MGITAVFYCTSAYNVISFGLENRTGADPFPSTPARYTAVLNLVRLNRNHTK